LEIKKVFLCGGDKRSLYMAEYFKKQGYGVQSFGYGEPGENLGGIREADITVLGLPAVKNGYVNMPLSDEKLSFSDLLSKCKKGSVTAGGRFTPKEYVEAERVGICLKDYSADEIFQVENAFYTAEGALSALIGATDLSLNHMKILIAGSGRISKALCMALNGFGSSLCVYARSETERCRFAMQGIETLSAIGNLGEYDAIINTVPADIFPESAIRSMNKNSVILDLSASPGYVDKKCCEKYNIKLLYLPGIPLSSAPQSAGITAAKAIERIVKQLR